MKSRHWQGLGGEVGTVSSLRVGMPMSKTRGARGVLSEQEGMELESASFIVCMVCGQGVCCGGVCV